MESPLHWNPVHNAQVWTANDGGHMAEQLMTIKQAAEYLNISHHTLYKLLERKVIPAAKVGGSWRFSPELLDEWLRKRMEESMGG